jgi:hypothetical protein
MIEIQRRIARERMAKANIPESLTPNLNLFTWRERRHVSNIQDHSAAEEINSMNKSRSRERAVLKGSDRVGSQEAAGYATFCKRTTNCIKERRKDLQGNSTHTGTTRASENANIATDEHFSLHTSVTKPRILRKCT